MKGRNWRTAKGRPYVRKKYIRGNPMSKIVKFVMGNSKGKFQYKLKLISKENIQVTHNALEATRISANKIMNDNAETENYLLSIKPYPHIILRENKMIATAGADRLQEGMRRAFGKSVSRAASLKRGDSVLEICTNKEYLNIAKEALKVGGSKLPFPYIIDVQEIVEVQAK